MLHSGQLLFQCQIGLFVFYVHTEHWEYIFKKSAFKLMYTPKWGFSDLQKCLSFPSCDVDHLITTSTLHHLVFVILLLEHAAFLVHTCRSPVNQNHFSNFTVSLLQVIPVLLTTRFIYTRAVLLALRRVVDSTLFS